MATSVRHSLPATGGPFRDAIREGDGNRILRCWRAMTLYFRYAGHINYMSEAVTMLSLVNATASSRISSQITWGRVVNTRGGAGRNIPVDLHMEHLNCTVKDYLGNLSANISESTILQCGRSLNGIQNVCSRFDQEAAVRPASIAPTHKGQHTGGCNERTHRNFKRV